MLSGTLILVCALAAGFHGAAHSPGAETALEYAGLAVLVAFGYSLGRQTNALGRCQAALHHARRRLRRLSQVDPLTGVLRRRPVLGRLRTQLRRSPEDGSTTGVILLDIDGLRQVNERFGLAGGDRVLRRAGRCLRRLARAGHSVGRLGSDAFLIVLPATWLHVTWRVAETLRTAVARTPKDPRTPPVTASLGVLALQGTGTVEDVLHRVHLALDQARAEGGNRARTSPSPSGRTPEAK